MFKIQSNDIELNQCFLLIVLLNQWPFCKVAKRVILQNHTLIALYFLSKRNDKRDFPF